MEKTIKAFQKFSDFYFTKKNNKKKTVKVSVRDADKYKNKTKKSVWLRSLLNVNPCILKYKCFSKVAPSSGKLTVNK